MTIHNISSLALENNLGLIGALLYIGLSRHAGGFVISGRN